MEMLYIFIMFLCNFTLIIHVTLQFFCAFKFVSA